MKLMDIMSDIITSLMSDIITSLTLTASFHGARSKGSILLLKLKKSNDHITLCTSYRVVILS